MQQLRAQFEALGLEKVETFIASGNVIFETRNWSMVKLEQKVESQLAKALGYEVSAFIRTDMEVAEIARSRPFVAKEVKTAGAFNVAFLAHPLNAASALRVQEFKTDIDDFRVRGREVFWLCRRKQSESRFSNNAFEKALKVRATFRGMSTISKLAAKYPPET